MPEIADMNGEELRTEASTLLFGIEQLDLMRRRMKERMGEVESRLLNDPTVRLKKGEGIAVRSDAVLRVHEEKKGRRCVVKEEVDKRAGELPPALQTIRDQRIVVESAAALEKVNPGLTAELRLLAASPLDEDGDEAPVKITAKDTYTTVAKIEKEYGKDSPMIGSAASERMVVLERPGIGEEPLLVSKDGMVGAKTTTKKED